MVDTLISQRFQSTYIKCIPMIDKCIQHIHYATLPFCPDCNLTFATSSVTELEWIKIGIRVW